MLAVAIVTVGRVTGGWPHGRGAAAAACGAGGRVTDVGPLAGGGRAGRGVLGQRPAASAPPVRRAGGATRRPGPATAGSGAAGGRGGADGCAGVGHGRGGVGGSPGGRRARRRASERSAAGVCRRRRSGVDDLGLAPGPPARGASVTAGASCGRRRRRSLPRSEPSSGVASSSVSTCAAVSTARPGRHAALAGEPFADRLGEAERQRAHVVGHLVGQALRPCTSREDRLALDAQLFRQLIDANPFSQNDLQKPAIAAPCGTAGRRRRRAPTVR